MYICIYVYTYTYIYIYIYVIHCNTPLRHDSEQAGRLQVLVNIGGILNNFKIFSNALRTQSRGGIGVTGFRCRVLQCVAVCCMCVAVCCIACCSARCCALHSTFPSCGGVRVTGSRCGVLQCVAVRCSALQCVAARVVVCFTIHTQSRGGVHVTGFRCGQASRRLAIVTVSAAAAGEGVAAPSVACVEQMHVASSARQALAAHSRRHIDTQID